MEWLLLAFSVFLGATKSILSKRVNTNGNGMQQTVKANIVLFFFAFCFIGVFVAFNVENWSVPWVLAIAYAVCVLFSQISLMKAVEYGSVAISSLFYSCGFIIPTVWGCIYFQEGINILHIVGIALILLAFILSVEKKQGKSLHLKWLIAALGGTLFSGLVGVIQKIFGKQQTSYSLDLFLFISFAIIIVLNAIIFGLYCFKKEDKKNENQEIKTIKKTDWITVFFMAVLGVVMGGINKLNTYLAGVLPSVVMFPATNGGVIVMSAVLSAIIFKEKLAKKQIFSILLGFIAIVIIAVGQNI